MKKTLLTTMLTLFAAFAATADDVTIKYATKGKDYYNDGKTEAQKGEWYALVWVAQNSQFGGINADASLTDSDSTHNKLLGLARTAMQGNLSPQQVQMSTVDAAALKGGYFYIVLLDTRNADDTLNLSASAPEAVNGYKAVGSTSQYGGSGGATLKEATSLVVQTVSGIPADCPRPEFTYIKPQDGNVILKIGKTKDYLRYQVVDLNLKSGETSAISGAEPFNGRMSESDEVELTFPATSETNGFFQVIRQPLH